MLLYQIGIFVVDKYHCWRCPITLEQLGVPPPRAASITYDPSPFNAP